MTPPLSPTAQAVMDAFIAEPVNSRQVCDGRTAQVKLAAALIAAAGNVPKDSFGCENYATGFTHGIRFSCQFLHDLAAELKDS
jgi:hypothetical protein